MRGQLVGLEMWKCFLHDNQHVLFTYPITLPIEAGNDNCFPTYKMDTTWTFEQVRKYFYHVKANTKNVVKLQLTRLKAWTLAKCPFLTMYNVRTIQDNTFKGTALLQLSCWGRDSEERAAQASEWNLENLTSKKPLTLRLLSLGIFTGPGPKKIRLLSAVIFILHLSHELKYLRRITLHCKVNQCIYPSCQV